MERLADVAAAVTVITGEDLHRMGVMNLRTGAAACRAPARVAGLGTADTGSAARGFAISTANKMLVLIDGRTVYSPVFAGVFWETQDLVIADVDRIEITRGPGGKRLGRQRRQRRNQRDHETRRRNQGHVSQRRRWHERTRPVRGASRRALGSRGRVSVYAKARFEDYLSC